MSDRSERVVSDVLLIVGLAASFLTHENGVLVHSFVSLVFTSKAVVNQVTALSLVLATVTGLVFWWAGDRYALGHGPISVVATVSVVPHVWVHRRALIRLVRRSSPGRRTRATQ